MNTTSPTQAIPGDAELDKILDAFEQLPSGPFVWSGYLSEYDGHHSVTLTAAHPGRPSILQNSAEEGFLFRGSDHTMHSLAELLPRHNTGKPIPALTNPAAVALASAWLVPLLIARVRELQKFKDYVHSRLDAAGIDPHEEQNALNGCRIGARLDVLLNSWMGYLVPCGCPVHGDHLGCDEGCAQHGCAHPLDLTITDHTELAVAQETWRRLRIKFSPQFPPSTAGMFASLTLGENVTVINVLRALQAAGHEQLVTPLAAALFADGDRAMQRTNTAANIEYRLAKQVRQLENAVPKWLAVDEAELTPLREYEVVHKDEAITRAFYNHVLGAGAWYREMGGEHIQPPTHYLHIVRPPAPAVLAPPAT